MRVPHRPGHRRVARVGPGALWAGVNRAAARYGLAGLAGRCSTVGVTGYTLGGGQSWLSRTCGFAAGNVVSADVVTADGTALTATARQHPDLVWHHPVAAGTSAWSPRWNSGCTR